MAESFVKIARKLKDKAFYSKDSEKVHLWVHLLVCANWEDKEELLGGKPIICKPGQFTTGRKQLSKQTGISESKIERILSNFEKIEQQIEQRKTSTNRLISILNWSDYQVAEQRIKQQVNNDRTTSEQQVNTLEEYKEEKNKLSTKVDSKTRIQHFKNSLYPFCKTKGGLYENETVLEFFNYWSELNKSQTKMRWELQKTFEVDKRLATWIKNDIKFKNGKSNNPTSRASEAEFLTAITNGIINAQS